jgi:ankyrin repeat protein
MFTMANYHAPGERKAELIRALVQRGADVNARNAKGQTTFMYACIMNQVNPLKVLLEQVLKTTLLKFVCMCT